MIGIDVDAERARVVAAARAWLRTPFHHAACIKGVGVDCVQLLAAVYDEAGIETVAPFGTYAADWFMHENAERYVNGLDVYSAVLAPGEAIADGDIALFKFGRTVSHAGILVDVTTSAPPYVIHAYRGIGVTMDQLTATDAMTARCVGYRRPRRWIA